jgi:hypothetical protein
MDVEWIRLTSYRPQKLVAFSFNGVEIEDYFQLRNKEVMREAAVTYYKMPF